MIIKNPLNKRYNKLVTKCNQLNLGSIDDKYYLTDVARRDTILKLIELILPEKVELYHQFFDYIEGKERTIGNDNYTTSNEISTDF